MRSSPDYEAEPLAYVLIDGGDWRARQEEADPRHAGPPLASIIEDRLATERGYELDNWEHDDEHELDDEDPTEDAK